MRFTKARCTWLLSLLCGLAFIAPGASLADDGPRLLHDPSPGTQFRGGPGLLEVQPEAEPAPSALPPGLRIAAEVGAMVSTAFIMALPGALVGMGFCGDEANCSSGAGYGAVGGLSIGAPLGVWWGARITRGKGTLQGAFLGSGTATGAWAVATLFVTNDDLKPLMFPVASMVGALVGYELSHAANSRQEKSPAVSLQPTVVVGHQLTMAGLSGSF
jgi:hypothetical protein